MAEDHATAERRAAAEEKRRIATKVREFHFAKIRHKRRSAHADPEEADEELTEPAETLSKLSDRVKDLLSQPSISSVGDRRRAYADARQRISGEKSQKGWANIKGATRGKAAVQGFCGAIRGQVRGRNVVANWLGAIRGDPNRPDEEAQEEEEEESSEDDDDGLKVYHGGGVVEMVKLCEELRELGEPTFVNEVQGCIEELKDTELALHELKSSLVEQLDTMGNTSNDIEDSVALARQRIARFEGHVYKARRRMTRQLTRRKTSRRLSNLSFEGQRARTPSLMDEVSERHVRSGEHDSGPEQTANESQVPESDIEVDELVDEHVKKLTEALCDSMTRLEDQILSDYRSEIQPLTEELGIEAPEFLQPDRHSRATSNNGSRATSKNGSRVQTASLHGSRAPTASSQHRPRSRVAFQDGLDAVDHLDDLRSLSTEDLHAKGIRPAEVAGIRDSQYAHGSNVEDMNAAGVVDFTNDVEGGAPAASAYAAAAIYEIQQQLKMLGSEGCVRIEDWNQRYAHHLGSLETFLERRPDIFEVAPGEDGEYRVKLVAGASRFAETAWECEPGMDPNHTWSTSPADPRESSSRGFHGVQSHTWSTSPADPHESSGRGFHGVQSAREILPGIIVYNKPSDWFDTSGSTSGRQADERSSRSIRPRKGRAAQKRHGVARNEPLPILEVVAAASRPTDETDPSSRSVLEKAAAAGTGSEKPSQAAPAPQDHVAYGRNFVDMMNEGMEDETVFTNLGADIDVGSAPLAELGIAAKMDKVQPRHLKTSHHEDVADSAGLLEKCRAQDSSLAFGTQSSGYATQPSGFAFGTQSTALPSSNSFLAPFSASATNFEWFGLAESRSEPFLHSPTVKDFFKNSRLDKMPSHSAWSKWALPEVPPTRGGWPAVRGTPAEKTRTRLMRTQTGDDVFLPPLPQTPPRTAIVETMSQHTLEAVRLDRRRLSALKSHPSRAAQPKVNFPKKPWEHNAKKPAQPFGGPALLRVGRSARSPVPRRGAPDMHQSMSLPQLPNGLGLHHLSAWRKSFNCAPERSPRAKH